MNAMQDEMAKLNRSQRAAMRRIVSTSLSDLQVDQRGWKSVVRAESLGFVYLVQLGPRGAVLEKKIWERA